jgi:3D (Asp-Asp-Asp) domain-containing protein
MPIEFTVHMKLCVVAALSALLALPATAEAARKRPAAKTMKLSATAYCLSGKTHSGQRARAGTVAADPRVLPIGTVLRIHPHRGLYTVLDTGSGLKGREIDIYMPSCRKARAFGRRTVRVEIVRGPSLR